MLEFYFIIAHLFSSKCCTTDNRSRNFHFPSDKFDNEIRLGKYANQRQHWFYRGFKLQHFLSAIYSRPIDVTID